MKPYLWLICLLFSGHVVFGAEIENTPANCGVNSSVSLARDLGLNTEARSRLQIAFPSQIVSLLQVKQMCDRLGMKTYGVRTSFEDLSSGQTPCIISLKNPSHFMVLLDATKKIARVLDGDEGELQVIPRKGLEDRFTGIALIPELPMRRKGPNVIMPFFDEYQVFAGMGQVLTYRFPLRNSGLNSLSVEVLGTSCGCTGATFEGLTGNRVALAPGSSTVIEVKYEVQTQMLVQQTVSLKTNDPRVPRIYLSIRGQLPPQLVLSPPALYVRQAKGMEPNKEFRIFGPLNTQIVKVWSNLRYLQFAVGEKTKDGIRAHWQIKVLGFGNALEGPIDGKIFVSFKDGTKMFLFVRGQIDSGLPGQTEAMELPRAEEDPNADIAVATPTAIIGLSAPDFIATDMSASSWKLSDLKGKKNLLLTFFPKCFTGGCANHLSSLRDHQADFDAADTQILAVSVDPADGEKGQKAFAEQWHFTFPLIPDVDRKLSMLYGATQNTHQRDARMTVLIDKQGIVRYIDTNVNVKTHGADMLAKMKELGMIK